jgi:hypothetical protein
MSGTTGGRTMAELSDISQHMPRLIYVLVKAGATPSTINSFRAHQVAAGKHLAKLPCPHCFARGRDGWVGSVKTLAHGSTST